MVYFDLDAERGYYNLQKIKRARTTVLPIGELHYRTKARTLLLRSPKGAEIYLKVDVGSLPLLVHFRDLIDQIEDSSFPRFLWANPDVQLRSRLNTRQLFSISVALIACSLNLISIRQLWGIFSEDCHHTTISYLKDHFFHGQLFTSYKFALLKCFAKNLSIQDAGEAAEIFLDYGLHPNDAVYFIVLKVFRQAKAINAQFDHPDPLRLSLSCIDKEVQDFADSKLMSLCNFQAYKNLLFLTMGGSGLTLEDLSNELLIATLNAYKMARPFKGVDHSKNYARRSMTNFTSRIIRIQTEAGRTNMWRNSEGAYVTRHVSLSAASGSIELGTDADQFSSLQNSLLFTEETMFQLSGLSED